ncbi:MAG TPA: DUF5647 family protein [Candidatus Saccharimonadales bacterium]|nr:DUF5647 family protein [Candidatus Saccharimonadales bacterium]
MSKTQQANKNIVLTEKLAMFLTENPQVDEEMPDNVSYVTFSAKDKNLNELNAKLIESLLHEGKQVVRAEETKDKSNPWKFSIVSV